MPIYWRPCQTCAEPATVGSSFCAGCEAFNRELAEIRRREQNEAIVTRYLRSNWKDLMRVLTTHHHKCQSCQVETECCGERVENYDGEPAVICLDFHLPHGEVNHRFVCDTCAIQRERRFFSRVAHGEAPCR